MQDARGKMQETVMTVEEVAAYLRVNEATIYRLIRAGQLPAVRIGRVWRVRRDLLEEQFRQRQATKREETQAHT